MTISIATIGHNEQKNLQRCLESVKWANEIVYVDCQSTDKSIEIAKKYTQKIFSRENTRNLNINKQFAIDNCKSDWVLLLDPDEVVPEMLKTEILKTINLSNAADGYLIDRRNFYFGHWLRFGGKYPDRQLRLFRNGKARFACIDVHERITVTGKVLKLKNHLKHYPYNSSDDILRKINFYPYLKAEKFIRKNKKVSMLTPALKFMINYFLKLGFLDGSCGFTAALTDAFSSLISVLIYREKY